MAEQDASQDKQLPATERRLQKAAEEGQVARSRDLSHAAALVTAVIGLELMGRSLTEGLVRLVHDGLRFSPQQALESAWMARRLAELGASAFALVWPLLALLAVALGASAMGPGGPVLTTRPLQPKLSRISPMAGIGRIFSKEALVNLVKLVAIAVVLAVVAWVLVSGSLGSFAGLSQIPLVSALPIAVRTLMTCLAALTAVLVLVACLDVPWQMYRHRSQLRMSHQEVREEVKEAEGDPLLRGRIRQRQREIGRARMLAAVPKADVVITNPTHYAVAIRYDEARMGAPRVVAKGVDHLALTIRSIAKEHGVTLVELPPLARALYANVPVDREIPAALYGAVAQVLAYVYQLRRFVPGRSGRMPEMPGAVEVPPALDPHQADGDIR